GLDRVVRALDLARDAIDGVRRTLRIASQANLAVVGLASFGLANPVTSILLSHGTTVAAAVATAARPGRPRPGSGREQECSRTVISVSQSFGTVRENDGAVHSERS